MGIARGASPTSIRSSRMGAKTDTNTLGISTPKSKLGAEFISVSGSLAPPIGLGSSSGFCGSSIGSWTGDSLRSTDSAEAPSCPRSTLEFVSSGVDLIRTKSPSDVGESKSVNSSTISNERPLSCTGTTKEPNRSRTARWIVKLANQLGVARSSSRSDRTDRFFEENRQLSRAGGSSAGTLAPVCGGDASRSATSPSSLASSSFASSSLGISSSGMLSAMGPARPSLEPLSVEPLSLGCGPSLRAGGIGKSNHFQWRAEVEPVRRRQCAVSHAKRRSLVGCAVVRLPVIVPGSAGIYRIDPGCQTIFSGPCRQASIGLPPVKGNDPVAPRDNCEEFGKAAQFRGEFSRVKICVNLFH